MYVIGEKKEEAIRPAFDKSISIDFQGAKITSDAGFLLLREVNERFRLLEQTTSGKEDPRSVSHTDHSLLQLPRQRVYQVAGYVDCNDADYLRVYPFQHWEIIIFVVVRKGQKDASAPCPFLYCRKY